MKILDKGYIYLVNTMGDELTIVKSARVSYITNELRKPTEADNKKLLKYLYKNEHMTPFEMVVFTFEIKAPLFVARQWFRHRAGSFNEQSGRYSEFEAEYYMPESFFTQDKKNKQGSGEIMRDIEDQKLMYKSQMDRLFNVYKGMLNDGMSKEQARFILPMSTYTKFIWKVDLRNLLHFLHLRTDEKAQWEIRQYAEAIVDNTLKKDFPTVYEAWKDGK